MDRNQLAIENLDLVGHVVAEVSARYPRHVDRKELWNAGALGLVEASRRFNQDAGIPFARYAAIRVRGAIIDSTRSRDWATRSVRRNLRDIQQATDDFEERNGRRPRDEDLATSLGISVAELTDRQAQASYSSLLHLDHDESDEAPLRELITEERTQALPEDSLEHRELLGTLKTALDYLPPVQAEVVARYYLSGDLLQDIANDLNVTEARISQIRAEAITSMRSYFSTLYDGVAGVADSNVGKRARSEYLSALSSETTWRSRLDVDVHPDHALVV